MVPGSGKFRVIDVGGERAERKKWIHAFDNSPTVLFLAPMSDYDQALYEDKNGVSSISLHLRPNNVHRS
jgi:hypothetical protein